MSLLFPRILRDRHCKPVQLGPPTSSESVLFNYFESFTSAPRLQSGCVLCLSKLGNFHPGVPICTVESVC